MRIGSILFTNQAVPVAENQEPSLPVATLVRVKGQDGDGLKVETLFNGPGIEFTLQPGMFHRLDDKKFEKALQNRFSIDPEGEKLPNPKQPVYGFHTETEQDGSFGEGQDEEEELDEEDEEELDEEDEEELDDED